jgi:hypothetical protein
MFDLSLRIIPEKENYRYGFRRFAEALNGNGHDGLVTLSRRTIFFLVEDFGDFLYWSNNG